MDEIPTPPNKEISLAEGKTFADLQKAHEEGRPEEEIYPEAGRQADAVRAYEAEIGQAKSFPEFGAATSHVKSEFNQRVGDEGAKERLRQLAREVSESLFMKEKIKGEPSPERDAALGIAFRTLYIDEPEQHRLELFQVAIDQAVAGDQGIAHALLIHAEYVLKRYPDRPGSALVRKVYQAVLTGTTKNPVLLGVDKAAAARYAYGF